MTLAFTVPIAAFGAATVKAAADFEQQMARVTVAAQRPGDSFADLRDELSDVALEMSRNTIFTTEQTADAMLELARAGLTTRGELRRALGPALNLAAIDALETDEATRILINTLKQFELTTEDSERVANALARTANVSTTDIKSLGNALSFVGPIANEFNLSVEETTGLLGLLEDRGVRSTKAGRSLRSVFNSLIDPTKEAKEKLDFLGVSVQDAEGNIRPFGEILQDLRNALTGQIKVTETVNSRYSVTASEAQRAAEKVTDYGEKIRILNEIDLPRFRARMAEATAEHGAGSKQARSAASTLAKAQDRLRRYTREWNEANNTLSIARGEQEKVFTKTVELTQAQRQQALATIFTNTGLTSLNALLSAGDDALAAYLKEVNQVNDAQSQAESVTDTFLGALRRLRNVLTVLGIRTMEPFLREQVTPLIKRFTEIVMGVESLDGSTSRFIITFSGLIAAIGPALLGLGTLLKVIRIIGGPIGILTIGIAAMGSAFLNNTANFKDWIRSGLTAEKVIKDLKRGFEVAKGVFEQTLNPIDALKEGIKAVTGASTEAEQKIAMRTVVQEAATGPGIPEGAGAVAIPSQLDRIKEQVKTRAQEIMANIRETLSQNIPIVRAKAIEIGNSVLTEIKTWPGRAFIASQEIMFNIIEAIVTEGPKLFDRLSELGPRAIEEFLATTLPNAAIAGAKLAVAMIRWIRENWLPLAEERLPTIASALIRFIVGLVPRIVLSALKLGIAIIRGLIRGAINFVTNFIPEVWPELVKEIILLGEDIGDAAGDLGSALVDGFIQGIKDTTSKLVDFLKDWVLENIPGPIRLALGMGSPAAITQPHGRSAAEGIIAGFRKSGLGRKIGQATEEAFRGVSPGMGGMLQPAFGTPMPRQQPAGGPITLEIGTLIGDERSIEMLAQKAQDALRNRQRFDIPRLT